MKTVFVSVLHRILEVPLLFEMQQRLFNDYSNVHTEFADLLDRRDLSILDVGCSTGACAATIVDMDSNRYVGIDLEPKYVALAAQRFPAGKFLAMDARRLEFPDESFDLALFIGVLHHMDDATAIGAMQEVARVLRPGGHVIVAEPVFTPRRPVSNILLRMDRGDHVRDEPRYRGLFSGFKVERQRYFPLSLHRFSSFVLAPVISGRLAPTAETDD